MSVKKITYLKNIASKAIAVSCFTNRGPVHINFPFRKPFEPDTFTDNISPGIESLLNKTFYLHQKLKSITKLPEDKRLFHLANKFSRLKKGLIIVGPENYGNDFYLQVNKLSKLLGYPLLADGTSQLRYKKLLRNKLICNYEAMFRSQEFINKYAPEVIIHFGRTPTSKGIDDFYESNSPLKIIVNQDGDVFDPSRKGIVYKYSPAVFCRSICEFLPDLLKIQDTTWTEIYNEADNYLELLKGYLLSASTSLSEPGLVNDFLREVPENSTIMLSNSLPVRDFDFFASRYPKNLTIFQNRGASGIDGIISTALGIASVKKNPVYLITGDIAFYYDINALLIAKKYEIPLNVILINNNGGGIFNSLPIARYKNFIDEYFITSHNLDFKKLTEAFGVKCYSVRNLPDFLRCLKTLSHENKTVVIEIKTDSYKSLKLRKRYWEECQSLLKKLVESHLPK